MQIILKIQCMIAVSLIIISSQAMQEPWDKKFVTLIDSLHTKSVPERSYAEKNDLDIAVIDYSKPLLEKKQAHELILRSFECINAQQEWPTQFKTISILINIFSQRKFITWHFDFDTDKTTKRLLFKDNYKKQNHDVRLTQETTIHNH